MTCSHLQRLLPSLVRIIPSVFRTRRQARRRPSHGGRLLSGCGVSSRSCSEQRAPWTAAWFFRVNLSCHVGARDATANRLLPRAKHVVVGGGKRSGIRVFVARAWLPRVAGVVPKRGTSCVVRHSPWIAPKTPASRIRSIGYLCSRSTPAW